MGIIELFFLIFLTVGIGWLMILALGTFMPGHPGMIDNVVWFVVIVVVLVILAQAFGLTGYDPRVPRLR